LHDDINQQLAVLSVELDRLRADQPHVHSAKRLSRPLETAQGVSTSVRELSHRLHPSRLQLVGLVAGLESLRHDFSPTRLSVAFSHRNVPAAIDPVVDVPPQSSRRREQERFRRVLCELLQQRADVLMVGEGWPLRTIPLLTRRTRFRGFANCVHNRIDVGAVLDDLVDGFVPADEPLQRRGVGSCQHEAAILEQGRAQVLEETPVALKRRDHVIDDHSRIVLGEHGAEIQARSNLGDVHDEDDEAGSFDPRLQQFDHV
jgi:hypothetical protein